MKNKTVMQHAFSMVPNIAKPRSVFDRSHGYKTTFDSDYLIPFYAKNVLPGDSVSLRHSAFIRMSNALNRAPMDNLWFDTFYFFVPYRLVWTNFQKFMGEQANPGDSISYTVPQCTGPNVAAGGVAIGSLMDYFGIPTEALSTGGGTTGITYNNLWPRAYNLIWNQWFRDQNLQNSVTVDTGDGPDTYTNYSLLKRGKKHDYFTSALPFLQKGTAVTIPLGTSATVMTSSSQLLTGAQNVMTMRNQGTGATPGAAKSLSISAGGNAEWNDTVPGTGATGWYPSNLYADLSSATAATINTMRQSIALQQFLENDARGGTRYIEIIRQRWGVNSPDARLQRPELLSLHSSPIRFNAVTSTDYQSGFVGYIGAFGTGADVDQGFTKSFTEHGVIIGLSNVRADITYAQGLERVWSYRTRYDFYNPEFAHLGEQSILNKEIFADCPDGTGASQKDGVFGYQERYAEERYSNSMVTGLMRPDAASSLASWNLTELFSSLPTLGSTFIQSNANGPVDRASSNAAQPSFLMDVYFKEKWARIMPVFGVPGLLKL